MAVDPQRRLIYEVGLEPTTGSLLQPTGFPDIGAAEFERPVRQSDGTIEWVPSLLVESPQSMANRLEAVGWDEGADQPVPALAGLPWVRVVNGTTGEYLTSSRTEAHRLASAFVKDADLDGRSMKDVIRERLDLRDDTPLSARHIAAAVMALDPLCLIHGVFFSDKEWPGQPKIQRAVTAVVEAHEVKTAHSGGVKKDHVRHKNVEGGGSTEGYGTIPFHRTEYTAGSIVGYFTVDRDQIAAYGLGDAATDLLEAVALWEVRTLLDGGMRLRTACDLAVSGSVTDQAGDPLPDADELEARIRTGVEACAALLGVGGPLDVEWSDAKAK
ncbi:MAG: type I-U CRISPR-associated protein Cas7 [Deltaproteobacteria bacterium]|nr:MAG: type I-U CRISPR-associated protein Cas7 [Deltaproteobacteria bacterium]